MSCFGICKSLVDQLLQFFQTQIGEILDSTVGFSPLNRTSKDHPVSGVTIGIVDKIPSDACWRMVPLGSAVVRSSIDLQFFRFYSLIEVIKPNCLHPVEGGIF